MSKEQIKIKIAKLNLAYKKIKEGIDIIKELHYTNNDVFYYVWKFSKIHDQLQKKILKLITQEQLNEDWEDLVIQLNKEDKETK